MKRVLAVMLCLAIPAVTFAADKGGLRVDYDGGSLPALKAGAGLNITPSNSGIRIAKGGNQVFSIPPASVTEISYGQDVHRRVGAAVAVGIFTLGAGALVALSKSKKHFVGLTWAHGDKKRGLANQGDKNEYPGILAALEGVTGKKTANSETM